MQVAESDLHVSFPWDTGAREPVGIEVEGTPEDPHPCHSGAECLLDLVTSPIRCKHRGNGDKKLSLTLPEGSLPAHCIRAFILLTSQLPGQLGTVIAILEMAKLRPGEITSLASWVAAVSLVILTEASVVLKSLGVMGILTSLMSVYL